MLRPAALEAYGHRGLIVQGALKAKPAVRVWGRRPHQGRTAAEPGLLGLYGAGLGYYKVKKGGSEAARQDETTVFEPCPSPPSAGSAATGAATVRRRLEQGVGGLRARTGDSPSEAGSPFF